MIDGGYKAVEKAVDAAAEKADREIRLKRELTEREKNAVPAAAGAMPSSSQGGSALGASQGGSAAAQSGSVTRVIVAEKLSTDAPKPPKRKALRRDAVFDRAVLTNVAEVDDYLASVRAKLIDALDGNDSIRLS